MENVDEDTSLMLWMIVWTSASEGASWVCPFGGWSTTPFILYAQVFGVIRRILDGVVTRCRGVDNWRRAGLGEGEGGVYQGLE